MAQGIWIDGAWKASQGGVIEVENPATGEIVGEVANATQQDVDAAVASSKEAFYDGRWSRKTPAQRAAVLFKMADIIEERQEEIARIESEDTGKPYLNLTMVADIPFSADNLRFFAGAARDTAGSKAGEYAEGYTSMLRSEPCGVSAGICPWNYPFMMAAWKIGPALAAGCTSIIKPASITPRSTLLMGEIAKQAGLPDGVLNILTGGIGRALTEHSDIRMVSLTGATETGTQIMRGAADTVKRVHLELGGKAPMVVFADADVDVVAEKTVIGAFFNSGQDCTGATRILVERPALEKMTEAIVAATKNLKVGMPFDDTTEMGSLISKGHLESVDGFVQRAIADGAKLLTGGTTLDINPGGYFYAPTVLTQVAQDSEIVQKEVFGPVITIQAFDTEEQALAMSNDCDFGLASSVFTRDIGRALRVSNQLEYGCVWVNDHLPLTSEMPHGGFKQSGFGKDLSIEAIHDYQVSKHVMISLD